MTGIYLQLTCKKDKDLVYQVCRMDRNTTVPTSLKFVINNLAKTSVKCFCLVFHVQLHSPSRQPFLYLGFRDESSHLLLYKALSMLATANMPTVCLLCCMPCANCSSEDLLVGLGHDTGSELVLQGKWRASQIPDVRSGPRVRHGDGRMLLPSTNENLKGLTLA